jgi:hypothetical protein
MLLAIFHRKDNKAPAPKPIDAQIASIGMTPRYAMGARVPTH